MWWSKRFILAFAMAAVLGGCDYRPLYGEAFGGKELARELASIGVEPIAGRVGQQLRNALEHRLERAGAVRDDEYLLRVTLAEAISSVALRDDNTASRANLRLNGAFTLYRGDQQIWQGEALSVASYNVLDRQFATIVSQKDARERAAEQLADDIVRRLAVFLSRER